MNRKNIVYAVSVGVISSAAAVAAGMWLFNDPMTSFEIMKNFVTSTIGAYVVKFAIDNKIIIK